MFIHLRSARTTAVLVRGQLGFTLVEIIVGLGLAGILSLVTATLVAQILQAQNQSKILSNLTNFHEELRTYLGDPLQCLATLGPIVLSNGTTYNLASIKDAAGANRFSLNTNYGDDSFKLTALKFKYAPGFSPAPAEPGTGEGELSVTYVGSGKGYGTSMQPRTIKIQTRSDLVTGQLTSCIATAKMTDGIWRRTPQVDQIFFTGQTAIGTPTIPGTEMLTVAGSEILISDLASPWGRVMKFRKTRNGGALTTNDYLGEIEFQGSDGVINQMTGALISSLVTGPVVAGELPTSLVFQTRNFGAGVREQMRLDHKGNLGLGNSAPTVRLEIDGAVRINSDTNLPAQIPQFDVKGSGTLRLKPQTSSPGACTASIDGSLALASLHTLCVCNGPIASWTKASDGVTPCNW